MRITLIEPAPPGFHVWSFTRQVRLGLPLIGTMLRELGHDVRIYVESLGAVDWERVIGSDVVGISTITSTAMRAYRYAERVRNAGIPVVIGGPHVTFMPDEALRFADYVVRGEGEETMLELVQALQGVRSPDTILGLSYHDPSDGVPRHNLARPLRERLSDLPLPDLTLIERYRRINPWPVLTSRGCPFDCEFCSVVLMFGRRVRQTDNASVIAALRLRGRRKVFFCDDNFVMSKPWTKELLATMIRRRLGLKFSAQVRVDAVCSHGRVDHELLELMRAAGCYVVCLGLESANQETLNAFKKQQSVSDMTKGLAALRAHGIATHGMFVFGADSDTLETCSETVDFALLNHISTAQFMILTPLVGTRLWERLEAEGRIYTRDWSLYDGHHVVSLPKHMSPWELQQAAIQANKRFYAARRIPGRVGYRTFGFLLSHGWEKVPKNRTYLRQLRAFSEAREPVSILGSM